ncbi:hypothetical protein ABPG74_004813 [Tetrahymena malaccensis]
MQNNNLRIQNEYEVFSLNKHHFYENTSNSFKIEKICFSSERINIKILTSDIFTINHILSDDILLLFVEDQQLKKDSKFTNISEEKNENYLRSIDLYYFYDSLKDSENIYLKYSRFCKPPCKLFTLKDQIQNLKLKSKYYKTFQFSQLSHNILKQICFFLLPHESLNLFQTFKSNCLTRVIKEPTIWKQYFRYLELDQIEQYKEEASRESFLKLYKKRKLRFELKQCKSIYNQNYYCEINNISFCLKQIQIGFRAQGNFSLGSLQKPNSSQLETNGEQLKLLANLCKFKEENQPYKQVYEGYLSYQYPENFKMISGFEFNFQFGECGYSKKQIFKISDEKMHQFELFQLFPEKMYQKQFKFKDLSHNILNLILCFLYPHESLNLFLTVKSNSMIRVIKDPTLWKQYSQYLGIQLKNENCDRESFSQHYQERILRFELNECFSIFNQQYQCQIMAISFSQKQIRIDFRVQGDYSLGNLQNPLQSNLLINEYYLYMLKDLSQFKEESQPQQQVYQGLLIFEQPTEFKISSGQKFEFVYGSSGYSQKQILLITDEMIHKFKLFKFI